MNKNIIIGIIVSLLALLCAETYFLINILKDRKPADTVWTPPSQPYVVRQYQKPIQPANPSVMARHSIGFDEDDWDPFKEMEDMRRVMNRMFRDSYSRGLRTFGPDPSFSYEPEVDFEDMGSEYKMRVDLPGIDKDKINIKVQNNQLILSGERQTEKESEDSKKGYYHKERSFGSFLRSFPLPHDADTEKMTAETSQGVLTIRIPKNQAVKTEARQVPVSESESSHVQNG